MIQIHQDNSTSLAKLDAMQTFKKITADIDCEPQPGGHLYIAHKAKAMPALVKEAKLMREVFKYDARILDADGKRRNSLWSALGERYCRSPFSPGNTMGLSACSCDLILKRKSRSRRCLACSGT